MTSKDLRVIRLYEHKGVGILVDIDFTTGKVSLIERTYDNANNFNFRVKDWRFASRELEYMDGWSLILEAMQLAVKEAKKELEDNKAKKLESLVEKYQELDLKKFSKGSK